MTAEASLVVPSTGKARVMGNCGLKYPDDCRHRQPPRRQSLRSGNPFSNARTTAKCILECEKCILECALRSAGSAGARGLSGPAGPAMTLLSATAASAVGAPLLPSRLALAVWSGRGDAVREAVAGAVSGPRGGVSGPGIAAAVFASDEAASSAVELLDAPPLEVVDIAGNTPLLLALKLGDAVAVRELLGAGASALARDRRLWTAMEAAALCASVNEGITRTVVAAYEAQATADYEERLPMLREAMLAVPDFHTEGARAALALANAYLYCARRWTPCVRAPSHRDAASARAVHFEFVSWIPLVSRLLPSDVARIWKRGARVQMDATLAGFGGVTAGWRRSRISFLYFAEDEEGGGGGKAGHLYVVDHERRCWGDLLSHIGGGSGAGGGVGDADLDSLVDAALSTPAGQVDWWSKSVVFSPCLSWWSKEPVRERCGAWACELFDMRNLKLAVSWRQAVDPKRFERRQAAPSDAAGDGGSDSGGDRGAAAAGGDGGEGDPRGLAGADAGARLVPCGGWRGASGEGAGACPAPSAYPGHICAADVSVDVPAGMAILATFPVRAGTWAAWSAGAESRDVRVVTAFEDCAISDDTAWVSGRAVVVWSVVQHGHVRGTRTQTSCAWDGSVHPAGTVLAVCERGNGQDGEHVAADDGVLHVLLDNRYARWHSKRVHLRVSLRRAVVSAAAEGASVSGESVNGGRGGGGGGGGGGGSDAPAAAASAAGEAAEHRLDAQAARESDPDALIFGETVFAAETRSVGFDEYFGMSRDACSACGFALPATRDFIVPPPSKRVERDVSAKVRRSLGGAVRC